MSDFNCLATSALDPFIIDTSDLSYFHNRPRRLSGGAIMLCVKGEAEAIVDLQSFRIDLHTQIFLMPRTIFMLSNVSADFQVQFFAFSEELFEETTYRMEIEFFHFLKEHPVYHHSKKTAHGVELWLQLSTSLCQDREHLFRRTIIRNRLQNVFLEMYDKVKRNNADIVLDAVPGRQLEIFHRFITLVHDFATSQREVNFYADKLCVSTRYLSAITRHVAHASVKQIIDRMVVMEIRILLQSTDLSIQEIADRLSFPDQSYLGRYFKKHTGESPTAYRNGRTT